MLQERREDGGDGAFAVGAGDVNALELPVRIAELSQQGVHDHQARLDFLEALEVKEVGELLSKLRHGG